jgi:hypothetical protein
MAELFRASMNGRCSAMANAKGRRQTAIVSCKLKGFERLEVQSRTELGRLEPPSLNEIERGI